MDFPNGTSLIEAHKGHKHGHQCDHDHDHDHGHDHGNHHNHRADIPKEIPVGARSNPTSADLFQAIEVGDLPLVHYIVTRLSGSIQVVDSNGNTPLHACARKGFVAIARYLVELGSVVDAANSSGHTPLMYATTHGHIGMCSVLLSMGADASKPDNLGFNSIIHAAQFGNVFVLHHLLSNAKVDVNFTDNDGHTALCWAAYHGHEDVLEYFLSVHCPYVPHLGIMDKNNRSALHWAAIKNFPKACAVILNAKCLQCESDANDGSPGLATGPCPTGREMLGIADTDGRTPSECAAYKGHMELSQKLEYERNGIRMLGVPDKKSSKEDIIQYLSTFIPFHVIFWAMPFVPFYVIITVAVFLMWVHSSGVLKWTNRQKTLVPAGLLAGSLMAMFYTSILMELSVYTTAVMFGTEVLVYYIYWQLMFEDPGFIPPNESYIQKALEVSAKGIEPSSDYCRKCKIIKPPRAKHCHHCKACTDRHDHHCYWIYNCVAKKNYRKFYIFLIQVVFQILFYLVLSLTYLWDKIKNTDNMIGEGIPLAFTEYPQVTWMVLFFSSFLIPMLMLFGYHTMFVGKDITTYEMITGGRKKGTPGGTKAKKTFSIFRVISFLQHGTGILNNSNSEPFNV